MSKLFGSSLLLDGKKKIGERVFDKWDHSDLRNVRYCENTSCVREEYERFYIGCDINASNNMTLNGLEELSGESNLEHIECCSTKTFPS